jgi:hypothetical protein
VLRDIRQLGRQVYGQSKQNITFLLLFNLIVSAEWPILPGTLNPGKFNTYDY